MLLVTSLIVDVLDVVVNARTGVPVDVSLLLCDCVAVSARVLIIDGRCVRVSGVVSVSLMSSVEPRLLLPPCTVVLCFLFRSSLLFVLGCAEIAFIEDDDALSVGF